MWLVVSNTYCVVFFFVLYTLCCQFLWIAHILLQLLPRLRHLVDLIITSWVTWHWSHVGKELLISMDDLNYRSFFNGVSLVHIYFFIFFFIHVIYCLSSLLFMTMHFLYINLWFFNQVLVCSPVLLFLLCLSRH